MTDLLIRMAHASVRRVAASRRRESSASLYRRAIESPVPVPLNLDPRGFDLLAEIKRSSPSAGRLETGDAAASPDRLLRRAEAYVDAGAAAISVLTEPEEFAGSLDDLSLVARAVKIPVMRKDFLVDPYQVLEARAAGAAGVLLILRLVETTRLVEMLDAAAETGLFVLLEAFDEADLARAGELCARHRPDAGRLLLGLNCRDLATLQVAPSRFAELRAAFPAGPPAVAESGMDGPADTAAVARSGYALALVGSALMRAGDPGDLARRMIAAGRAETERGCVSG